MRTTAISLLEWCTFGWRSTLCVTLAGIGLWFRARAGRVMPEGHPIRDFEDELVKSLRRAEHEWFRSRQSG